MSKPRLGLGLIGTGNIGRAHLMGLIALRDAKLLDIEIAALCDIDEESLRSTANLVEPTSVYGDYNELVADENVNVVYICTPTNKHSDMVKSTAKLKKDIFCEKPLAHSAPQAQELFAVVKSAQVKASVGLVLRFDPFLLFAKELIAEKDFGTPMLAHIRDDQHFPVDYIYYSQWRGDLSIAGGGTLIEHSIHDIDILNWFFGDITSVFAKVGFFSEREVEDQASLIITHRNGVVSTIDSIWHMVERPSERVLEFFFEKGYIGITLESGRRWLDYQLRGEGPVRIHLENANGALLKTLGVTQKNMSLEAVDALVTVGTERYSALSYSFLKSVLSKKEPSPNFLDALAAHKVVDAAYESANLNRPVDLL
ncbi:MAG: Gfo/Idh/MocA family protein [Candidatus Hodarchaeota archaeon]